MKVLLALAFCALACGARQRLTPSVGKGRDEASSGSLTSISLNSRLVPRSVLQSAARNAGVLGQEEPTADAIANLAGRIDAWYRQQGYVLSRVVGHRAIKDGKLQMVVVEPLVAESPIEFRCGLPHPAPSQSRRIELPIPPAWGRYLAPAQPSAAAAEPSSPPPPIAAVPRWLRQRSASLTLRVAALPRVALPRSRPAAAAAAAEKTLSGALENARRAVGAADFQPMHQRGCGRHSMSEANWWRWGGTCGRMIAWGDGMVTRGAWWDTGVDGVHPRFPCCLLAEQGLFRMWQSPRFQSPNVAGVDWRANRAR